MTGPPASSSPTLPDSRSPAPKPSGHRASSVRPVIRIGMLVGVILIVLGLAVAVFRSLPADPATLRRQMALAQERGDWAATKRWIDQIEKVQPLSSGEYLLRSQAESQLGQPEMALKDLQRISDSDPLGSVARMSEGQIELRRQHLPAAERQFLRAIELDPRLLQAHRELIYIYGMQLRRDDLDREFRAYASLKTLDYSQCYLWCLSRSVQWDPNEQVETLRGFLQGDPSDRWSRLALADNLRRVGKVDEASTVLEPLPDDDPEALATRVQIALDRHDQETARAMLDSAPTDDPVLNQIRGQLALSRRDAETALGYFQDAIQADPLDRSTLSGLSSALRLLGRKEQAAEVQVRMRQLDQLSTLLARGHPKKPPEDPNYALEVGRACLEAKLLPQAEAWFRLAVASNPLNSSAKQALYDLLHRDGEDTSGISSRAPGF